MLSLPTRTDDRPAEGIQNTGYNFGAEIRW
jgi:hypothetical protein